MTSLVNFRERTRSGFALAVALVAALAVVLSDEAPTGAAQDGMSQPALMSRLPDGGLAGGIAKPAGRVTRAPLLDSPPPEPPRLSQAPTPKQTPFRDDPGYNPPEQTIESEERDSMAIVAQAAGTTVLARSTTLAPPYGYTSSVAEPSVGTAGNGIFMTHNWYAEVSTNNGATFSYVNPYTMFPATGAFAGGFCCDQRVAQDPSRDLIFWLQLYLKTASTPSGTNGYRIAVAHGQAGLAANTWQYHDITPADFGLTGKWLDFPHMQVSANYLYFTANAFQTTTDTFYTAVIGRIPLAALDANSAYTMNTYVAPPYSFGSIAPVNGATTTMYLAARYSTNSIKLFSWPEAESAPTVLTVSGLASTGFGTFVCTTPDGLNPCGRSDTRVQTGWVTSTELGFMFNAPADAAHSYPFTRVLILDPANPLTIISQPDIFSSSAALLYPAVAVNARGHLGGTIDRLGGTSYTSLRGIIRDDLSPDVTTNGWELFPVAEGNAGTSSRWGDYNGAVPHELYPNTWVAVGHVQQSTPFDTGSSLRNFWFMRERDVPGGGQTVTVSFASPTATVSEGAGNYTANLVVTTSDGQPAQDVISVSFATSNGSAIANFDYYASSGVMSWPGGVPNTGMLFISIINDTTTEDDETFTIILSNPAGGSQVVLGTPVQTVTIVDNDPPPAISISDVSVIEGNAGATMATFTATLSGASTTPVSVNYATASGTATAGPGPFNAGSINIPPTWSAVTPYPSTINVAGVGGTIAKVTATLTALSHTFPRDLDILLVGPAGQKVILMSDVGGGYSVSGVTLTFDDTGPALSTSQITSGTYRPTNLDDLEPAGGDVFPAPAPGGPYGTTLGAFAGGSANGQWSLFVYDDYPGVDGGTIAGWSLTFETTLPTGDYAPASGVILFPAGSVSQTITIAVFGDITTEPNETFFVNLSAPVNATLGDAQGQGTILNDDPPAISIGDVTMSEGSGGGTTNFTFAVSLNLQTSNSVSVTYLAASGTATAGADFTAVSGTVTFPAATTTASIVVPVVADNFGEANETFFVNLSGPINATLGDSQGVGTIVNDDSSSLWIDDVASPEGTSAIFTVSLLPASEATVTVQFATAAGTATANVDYTPASGTLTFPPNTTAAEITVPLPDDAVSEPDETFFVNLATPSNATIGDAQGVGTVVNDDNVLTITDVSVNEGNSGTTSATFTVTLTPAHTEPVSVSYATANGTATAGSDYTAAAGSLTFAPKVTTQTLTVSIIGDTAVEANETFFVNVSGAVNALITDPQAVGTIVNDDASSSGGGGGGGGGGSPQPVPPSAPPTPPPPPPSPFPGAPTGLTNTVSDTTVVLVWNAPTSGAPLSTYVVDVGSGPGASDLLVYPTGSLVPSLTATNVANGTYFVRVRAENALGSSPPSNETIVTVPGGGTPAAPPAPPTNLQATSVGSAVQLTWSPSPLGGPASFFAIEAGSASTLADLANFSTGSAVPSFSAGNVPNGTYYVRVRAGNALGVSAPSNETVLVVGTGK